MDEIFRTWKKYLTVHVDWTKFGQMDEVLQQLTSKVALPPEKFGQEAAILQQLTSKVALPPEKFGQMDEVLQQLRGKVCLKIIDVVSVAEWRITTHIQKDDVGVQRNIEWNDSFCTDETHSVPE